MNVVSIIIQIVLLVVGVALVLAVMFQKGKGGLSNTIAGGRSDSFMDRDKHVDTNSLLNKFTIIGSIVFVVLVIVVYVIQPDYANTTYAVNDTWKEISEFASSLD